MRYRKHDGPKAGFTLIELLVVIAIIAILAAILFPVFAQARSKARQTSGLSNMKQGSLAILMYTQDFDEQFPRSGWDCEFVNGVENACGATTWANVTAPYIKNGGIFLSPGDASETNFQDTASDGRHSLLINDLLAHTMVIDPNGYSSKFDQNHAASGLSQAAVNAPADCVLLAEGHCGWDKVTGASTAAARGPDWTGSIDIHNKWHREQTISGSQTMLIAGRSYNDWGQRVRGAPFYNGGANIGYVDGHAKWAKTTNDNGSLVICGTLKWTQHMDPSQRHAERDGCADPLNPPGGIANWE